MEEVRKRRQLKPEEKLQIYKEATVAPADALYDSAENMMQLRNTPFFKVVNFFFNSHAFY